MDTMDGLFVDVLLRIYQTLIRSYTYGMELSQWTLRRGSIFAFRALGKDPPLMVSTKPPTLLIRYC